MKTYQDFEATAGNSRASFISALIAEHKCSELYMTAVNADRYDRQKNTAINEYVRTIYSISGSPIVDFTAANNRIASNLFHRLNTQRNTYSLGNGVQFSDPSVKEKLGQKFDTDLKKLGYKALIHGISFGFWNLDRLYVFPVTEFAPLWDEYTGALRAGVRFWQLSEDKPFTAVLYEEDGFTKYTSPRSSTGLTVAEPKRAYKLNQVQAPIDPEPVVVGAENYGSLPIIPMWGSERHQSTLVGMKEAIDSYDLIRSGFANDLSDCAQIYWIVKNAGGMSEPELAKFREKLRINHIATVDADDGGDVQPYTQEIPYQARQTYLEGMKNGIYEHFGALDVSTLSSSARTATEINAAYQPMDEEADDYEYQIIEFIQQLLSLMGIEDAPTFVRNRIANETERTNMVLAAGTYLDRETVIRHLPFISADDVEDIMKRADAESASQFPPEEDEEDGGEDGEGAE